MFYHCYYYSYNHECSYIITSSSVIHPSSRLFIYLFIYLSLLVSSSLVELTEDILKQLMDLVFTLVCNGELSLARVLRKNILDKVEQKKLLRYTNSLKPLAARGVSAR